MFGRRRPGTNLIILCSESDPSISQRQKKQLSRTNSWLDFALSLSGDARGGLNQSGNSWWFRLTTL